MRRPPLWFLAAIVGGFCLGALWELVMGPVR